MTTTIFSNEVEIKPVKQKTKTYKAGFPSLLQSEKKGVDLGLFFRPEMLLNAFRQQSARNLSIAIDELNLHAVLQTLSSNELNYPSSSWSVEGSVPISIRSLRIQGAQWVDGRGVGVADSATPSTSLIQTKIAIAWIPFSDYNNLKRDSGSFAFPVYLNDSRAKLLTNISFPLAHVRSTKKQNELNDDEEWVLSGACVLLSQ
jgi:hypothetical protein